MASFEEEMNSFIAQIPGRKHLIKNEEGTKNGLIMPFIQKLGYDVFNPLEVCPEYTSDFGVKQKEKVDYAILKDGKPVIFIECKPVNADLNDKKYGSQLFRYFTTCDSSIVGILTNGLEYRFFSDTQSKNKMDKTPFMIINLESIRPEQIMSLEKFSKEKYDPASIMPSAENMMIRNDIIKIIDRELSDPSKEFENMIINQVYDGKMITASVRSKYAPLIRDAIKAYISDKITSKLQKALDVENDENREPVVEEISDITTTDDELRGLDIIRAICRGVTDPERVVMRDAKSYCAILLDDNNRKPICRLYFNSETSRYVATFDTGVEVKNKVSSPYDIDTFREQILKTVSTYVES
jgi:predicted type IV restriction endonuclease